MNRNLDKNILFVDDNHCYRRYIEFVFGENFNLLFASNGQECIRLYEDELIDLVLMDTALTDISANEICEMLKDDTGQGGIPVIFLSEYETSNERKSAYESGGDDYLSKDVSPNELASVVDIALDYVA